MTNPIPPAVKTCPGCKEQKPASEFGKNKRSADGLAYYCKPCFREVSKASYRKRKAEQGKEVRESREVPEGSKYCPRCDTIKLREDFGRNRTTGDGLTAYCKPCHSKVGAENRARLHGSTRSFHLKRRYGLTEEQVEAINARQGGICVICLRKPAKHVDHNHETGLFRGLLCFGCNGGLGQFEDHPWRLREAARYLDGVSSHWVALTLQLGEEASAGLGGQSRRFDRRTDPDAELGSPRKYHLWQKYGLEEKDVELLNRVQRGFCAICCDGRGEHVDHDHETTAVRGLLCTGCNSGMGQFKDDPDSIRRASDYLMGTLIAQIPDGKGGMRPSFTLPDVDPATVAPDGWAAVRKADGESRRALMELKYRLELPWESELV
jgi:hypothetical protein